MNPVKNNSGEVCSDLQSAMELQKITNNALPTVQRTVKGVLVEQSAPSFHVYGCPGCHVVAQNLANAARVWASSAYGTIECLTSTAPGTVTVTSLIAKAGKLTAEERKALRELLDG